VEKMDDCNGFTTRLGECSDALNLSKFAARTFEVTFGHLYPPEDTAEFLRTDYAEEIIMSWIQDEKKGVWITTSPKNDSATDIVEEVIIGYAVCGPSSLPRTNSSSGEVKKLYVDKEYFGKGVANALFETGVHWLRSAYSGYPIYISVYSENFRAIKFYNRYGFEFHDEYLYEVGANRDREFILRETDSLSGLPLIK
jgi:diamine N-acetyltransferase